MLPAPARSSPNNHHETREQYKYTSLVPQNQGGIFIKKLYFEGAGCVPRSDIPNCRIRTAFHLDDGRAVYLEISGMETTRSTAPCYSKFTNYGIIDPLHYTTGTGDDRADFGLDRTYAFEYTQANLLQLVNSLGASFDAVEVLHDLAGYRVHADNGVYNFGDEFTPDAEYDSKIILKIFRNWGLTMS